MNSTKHKEELKKYLEHQLAIDPERLDEEILAQPTLHNRAQQHIMDWKRSLNAAMKDHRKLRSELWIKIKNDPEKFKLEVSQRGATKDDIEQALLSNKHYKRSLDLIETLEMELEEAKNFLYSVNEKKSALKVAAELWLGNYFSTPSIRKSKEGKVFTDFVYKNPEAKMREKLLDSSKKRKEKREKVGAKLKDRGVKEHFDRTCDDEEKKDRKTKRKMLGLEGVKTKRKKGRSVLERRLKK